ncbi:MAG: GldG family protein [Dehalococcoidales bacterium]
MIAIGGVAVLFVGWIITLVIPELRFVAWSLLAVGVILILVAVTLDYRRVGRALVSRRGRFGTGTTLMVSVFAGIILLVNAISIGNYHRFDTTGLSQYTVTSQTKEALGELAMPVEAIGFFVPGDLVAEYLLNLLTEYQKFTDELTVTVIDPEQRPDQARLYSVNQYPTVVFSGLYGDRLVSPSDMLSTTEQGNLNIEAEHAFTSALLEVTGAAQRKVYFLSGHGENSPTSSDSAGYSTVREGLLDNVYAVETLDIRFAGEIPEDCTVLVIAGPETDLTSREFAILEAYLEDDGWAIIMANPNPPDWVRELVALWGMDIEDGIINDEGSYTAPNKDNPLVPVIRNWFSQFGLFEDVHFPGATALIPQEELPENLATFPLVWSSPDSWLEKDYGPGDERVFDEGIDPAGPLAIGVFLGTVTLGESQGGEEPGFAIGGTQIIVYGDSDFASNRHFQDGGNGALFLSSVNVLAVGQELITMDRKFLQTRRLIVSPEAKTFIDISSMALLPILVFVAGGVIWYRRR